MKTIHLILVGLLLAMLPGQAQTQQQQLPYKAKALFNTDTLGYLQYNFSAERSELYYNGKTVADVLRDLEYPLCSIFDHTIRGDKFVSISLGIHQVGAKRSPLRDYYIQIWFEEPPLWDDFRDVTGYDVESNPAYITQVYNYIKDLKVKECCFNPLIENKNVVKTEEQ